MSHSKERAEKNCLNCGEIVQGKYCQFCGQENIEPKESLWGLISHFFQDITHFDGKFFSTGRLLFTRPGFLPKEYIAGRRARYLHPIRMYVFTSALFFLIFYSLFSVKNWGGPIVTNKKGKTTNIRNAREEALKRAKTKADSASIEQAFKSISRIPIPVEIKVNDIDSTDEDDDDDDDRSSKADRFFGLTASFEDAYDSREQYDSAQLKLPVAERDGWWSRQSEYRNIELKKRYGEGKEREMWRDVADKFMHTFPYLLFLSLPLYAIILKLLYIRRRQFYYVDHALFLIYLYIFTFLFLLIFFGLRELQQRWDHWTFDLLIFILMMYGIYYAYKSMRKFYGQRRFKTIVKFLLLNFLAFSVVTFLFIIFFVYALLRV